LEPDIPAGSTDSPLSKSPQSGKAEEQTLVGASKNWRDRAKSGHTALPNYRGDSNKKGRVPPAFLSIAKLLRI
jgi:hypothetical protein